MAHECTLVAIPEGSRLLERAKNDPEYGSCLSWINIYESGGKYFPTWVDVDDQAYLDFNADVAELNRTHPGLLDRICELDRCYDKVHFLLSAKRRQGCLWDPAAADWATRAIRWEQALPEHLRGWQGFSTRYTPVGTVREIATILESVDYSQLSAFCDPAAMYKCDVYKMCRVDHDGSQWKLVCGYFDNFKAFYSEVAAHNEAVLVLID